MKHSRSRFDPEILDLIPHRPPMLLINQIASLSATQASAIVLVDSKAPFFEAGSGVPSWVGLEYMGQTAALIAGFQIRQGVIEPHLGFLLGLRQFKAEQNYFLPDRNLLVICEEAAVVGESLATFNCTIRDANSEAQLATASLSVFRKPSADISNK